MWHYLHMDCIYLEPPYRANGIGTWIMGMLVDYSKKLGIEQIQWQTPTWNSDAMKFYNSLGAKGKEKVRYTLDL
jgi:GNAT superfamily N-acetyltransferase